MPKLSLAFLTLATASVPDMIRAAGRAGFDGMGLRLLPATPQEPAYPLLDDRAALREARAAMAEFDVAVVDVEIVRLKAETDVADFLPFLERAAELGARHILVAGDDPDHGRLSETFAGFCALAAPFGLTGDLEFMPWTKVPDLATARRIVDAAGAPNGGVLVDAIHFDRSDTTLGEVRALPSSLVHYYQLCDGPADYDPSPEGLASLARTARLFPGDGAIDLAGLVQVLPADVPVSIEVPNHAWSRDRTPDEIAARALKSASRLLGRIPAVAVR